MPVSAKNCRIVAALVVDMCMLLALLPGDPGLTHRLPRLSVSELRRGHIRNGKYSV